jgi:hypothetical protein
MSPSIHVTTQQVWGCTAVVLVLDGLLAILAILTVSRDDLRRMHWILPLTAAFFFTLVWVSAMALAWDWFYSYIFPPWARYLLPAVFGIGYGLLALGMTWLCQRLPGIPALTWILLGGVEGLLSHLVAIYSLGAASKPPIMQGTDPMVVLIFAIFEKAFYWGLILLFSRFLLRFQSPHQSNDLAVKN